MKLSRLLAFFFLIFATTACASSTLRMSVPDSKVEEVKVYGIDAPIRFWGDEPSEKLETKAREQIAQLREQMPPVHREHPLHLNYLAISGGAEDGAFGAGLLAGWTDHGDRPQFDIVTGISTGALIAPFAFLGSEYDDEMQKAYTTLSRDDILVTGFGKIVGAVLGGTALTDTTPFAQTIHQFATEDMFRKIAEEHAKGRRLYIGTTNLDAERPVIWDIGELANTGHPRALELFRKILMASAAVPAAMPPILMEVETDEGQFYQELHVDGGVTSNVFLYPTRFDQTINGGDVRRTLFIIRNSKLKPVYDPVDFGLFSISRRSVSALIRTQGIGDLYKIKFVADTEKLDFNLAYIPPGFTNAPEALFDPVYMGALYDYAYQLGEAGYQWKKEPYSSEE